MSGDLSAIAEFPVFSCFSRHFQFDLQYINTCQLYVHEGDLILYSHTNSIQQTTTYVMKLLWHRNIKKLSWLDKTTY